jgi:acyl-CoA thioesterase FadM
MLTAWGFDELNAGGTSLIMADVMIAYKAESFYKDILRVEIYTEDITDISFDLLYKITTQRADIQTDVAHAKTGMVCFDYKERKIAPVTNLLREKLQAVQ